MSKTMCPLTGKPCFAMNRDCDEPPCALYNPQNTDCAINVLAESATDISDSLRDISYTLRDTLRDIVENGIVTL